MEKILQPSSGVENVGLGQVATHNLRKGPFYHHVTYYVTVFKTALTAGFTSATLGDALDLCEVRINTQARRSFKAVELDTIQANWGSIFASKAYDGIANDLVTAIADTVNATGANINGPGGVVPPASTQRATTFEFTIYFSEPFRKSYTAERLFGLPTTWRSGKTIDVQVALKVPNNAGISVPVVRAEEFIDFAFGPAMKALPNGMPDPTTPDVLPFVHFWRINKNYSSTQFSLTDWGSVAGKLQQVTLFGANDAGGNDKLLSYVLTADTVVKRKTTKIGNDRLNERYDFGLAQANPAAPYDAADVTHLALDVSDDPTDWFNFAAYRNVELALTLNQAVATNKSMVAIVQAFDLYKLP